MLILSSSALSPPAQADTATISSAGIMSAALDLSCQAYQVIGLCLWMTCTPVGCEFDYSVRAEHYIPEVVVSAYPFIGNTSWPEANHLASPTSFAEEGGASDRSRAGPQIQARRCHRLPGCHRLLGAGRCQL